eukprot:14136956-Alexandrium_andersonii.AAC.1
MGSVAGRVGGTAGRSPGTIPRGCAGHGLARSAAPCTGRDRPCAGGLDAVGRHPMRPTASGTSLLPRSPWARRRRSRS